MLSSLMLIAAASASETAVSTVHTIVIGPDYQSDFRSQPAFSGEKVCNELTTLYAGDLNATALCGAAASRAAILGSLRATTEKLGADDTLALVYIGSGWSNDTATFLLPSDFLAEDLEATSIEVERDIMWRFRELEGRGRVVVFIDAVHADSIHWTEYTDDAEVPKGVYTVGPRATHFADEIATNIAAVSATTGEYPVDENLFGDLLVRGLSGEADGITSGMIPDGNVTLAELSTFLTFRVQEATANLQTISQMGGGAFAEIELIRTPKPGKAREPLALDLASLRKPARYTGIGLSALGCTSLVVGRVVVAGAIGDLNAGDYADRGEYDDIVGRYRFGGSLYLGGIGACSAGLGLIGASLIIGNPEGANATVTPAGITGRF